MFSSLRAATDAEGAHVPPDGESFAAAPEKWHGLQDIEARYRQRYLDLLTNERSRAVFEKRIAIVRETRRFFEERGFLEVETAILTNRRRWSRGRAV